MARKTCIVSECGASARGKTGKCIKHGGGKRCGEPDCGASAVGKTDKCVAHGGGKRCVVSDCGASAAGKTDKCVAHGGGKRCDEPDCGASAQGKTDKCVAHGGGKRCVVSDCGASAVGKTDKCVAHGGGKRCVVSDCGASAAGKTDKCIAHGGGKRCGESDCGASAQGKTDKCVAHGGGKRCPNCIDWIDSRGGCNKYDGYCATCFQHLFPNDPLTFQIRSKTKEIEVRDFINTIFEGFVHDKPLYTGNCDCTHRRRIDHRKLIGNTMLATETDENQHIYYDKKDEEARYNDLNMIYSGKWIFIRFNPDKYKDKNGKSKNPMLSTRLPILQKEIEKQIKRIENDENKELEIIHLYYDGYN